MGDLHANDITVFDSHYIRPADPAVGNNFFQNLPLSRVEILSATVTLTTSAVAANRYIGAIFWLPGVHNSWASFCPHAQTAGLTHIYTFQRGIAPFFNALDPSGYTTIGFGTNIFADIAPQLMINVINILGGDQLSTISIVYASWPTPRFPA
jgi:hypothetical protein